MSSHSKEVMDDLAIKLAQSDKNFQNTIKSLIVDHEGPQGPVVYRYTISKNETGCYLQDNFFTSNKKAKIDEDFAQLMIATGAIGAEDNIKSQSLKK